MNFILLSSNDSLSVEKRSYFCHQILPIVPGIFGTNAFPPEKEYGCILAGAPFQEVHV